VNPRGKILRSAALCGAVAVASALVGTLPATASASVTQRGAVAPGSASSARSAAAAGRASARAHGLSHVHPDLSDARPSQGAAAYGDIVGLVRDAAGAALTGACVTVSGPSGTVPGLTRAGGRYLFTGLLPGRYTVRYRDCGQPGRYFGLWYGGSAQVGDVVRVLVTAGLPTVLKPVTLRPASPASLIATTRAALRRDGVWANGTAAARRVRPFISGTVRGVSGRGLAGICVSATTVTANSAETIGVITGRGGSYSFPGRLGRPGSWTVNFFSGCGNPGNYAPQWWKNAATAIGAFVLHARRGSHFVGINARLVAGAAMTGVVRAGSASGTGLGGVCVQAIGIGRMNGVFEQAVTANNGTYQVIGLGTGLYIVDFSPGCGVKGNYIPQSYPGFVSATDGKTTKGINGFLPLAVQITGTVTTGPSSTPVAGICVQAVSRGAGGSAVTGKQGSYTIPQLAAGQYTVSFSGGCGNTGSYAPQYYNGKPNAEAADLVTATAGQTVSGINATMQPGGTVTGTLTSTSGRKLSGICVVVSSQQAAGGLGSGPIGLLLTGLPLFSGFAISSNGGYRISNLAPGSYLAAFSAGCGNAGATYAAQWFAPQGGNSPAWLSVGAGTITSGVGATLRLAGAITGEVKTAAGKGLSGICAFAVGLTGQPSASVAELLTGSLPASRKGRYQITGLAGGKYAVEFEPCNGQPYAATWYSNASSAAAARPVTVRDDVATTGINQVLTGGQSLSGQVTSAVTGRPLRGACVAVLDAGRSLVTGTQTGPNGTYNVAHLAAGRYNLEFFSCALSQAKLAGVIRADVLVGSRRAVTGVNATLALAGSMTGTVLGGTSAVAQPGVCVEAVPKTGNGLPGLALTGADGSYSLAGLAAGTYLVQFTSLCPFGTAALVPQWFSGQPSQALATPVLVTSGAAVTGVGGTLAADGGISGTVQVAAVAKAGVCVIAYPAAGGQPPAVAETGADGSYQIGALVPGSYLVEFTVGCGAASYATQWYSAAASRSTATPVVVTAGTVSPAIDAH